MRCIKVYGDGDYGALSFEQSELFNSKEELYAKAVANGGSTSVLLNEGNDEEEEIYIDAINFGQVDPAFFDYVINELCDYDMLKHTCIYSVEV